MLKTNSALVEYKMPITSNSPYVASLQVPIVVHECQASAIVINYPGRYGAIDGYKDKHIQIANLIVERKLAGVVRMPNLEREKSHGIPYHASVVSDLSAVIDYVERHDEEICGWKNPEIWLMGASAGASAIAALSGLRGNIAKILLLEPASSAGEHEMSVGLGVYTGDLCIVVGSGDFAIGEEFGRKVLGMAPHARRKEIVVLPDCDHQFKGARNGVIMSKAPFWAFGDDTTFPDPAGGTVLY